MSFDSLESSLESSEPRELYRFLLGSEKFLYSNSEEEVTIASDDYIPESIKRDELVIGREERGRVLSVEVPATNALAQRYIGTPPGQRASLSIFRQQRQDGGNETALIYKGSILSVQFPEDNNFARIALQSIESASSREIPRMTYMFMCNHILYDVQCKVIQNNFKHIGNVSVISAETITVSGAGASGLDFTGGFAKPQAVTDFRLVIAHSGDLITLLLPFEQDPTGGNVELFAGCDHQLEGACSQTFANEIEFGGFAFVPKKNVFNSGV